MAVTFTFDGDNRKIYMDTDASAGSTIEVDIADIYSEWKRWCVNGDGLKYPHAFEVIGGEPISDTTRTGTYFFMQPEWTGVPPDKDNMTVIIKGNLFPAVVGDPVMTPRENRVVSLIMRNSSLTQTVTINSGSGLSAEEHNKLMSIDTANLDVPVSSRLATNDTRLDNLDERISTRASQTSVNDIPINPLLDNDERLDKLNNLDVPVSSRKANTDDFTDNDRTTLNDILTTVKDILDIESGNWELKPDTKEMIFYDLNGNIKLKFKLYNQNGIPDVSNVFKRVKQ